MTSIRHACSAVTIALRLSTLSDAFSHAVVVYVGVIYNLNSYMLLLFAVDWFSMFHRKRHCMSAVGEKAAACRANIMKLSVAIMCVHTSMHSFQGICVILYVCYFGCRSLLRLGMLSLHSASCSRYIASKINYRIHGAMNSQLCASACVT